ncbi:MAG: hypothetical protein Q6363_003730 [Candidatus Njordarchaeota archaeon]
MLDIAHLCFAAQALYLYVAKKLSLHGVARKINASYNAVRNIALANDTIRPKSTLIPNSAD